MKLDLGVLEFQRERERAEGDREKKEMKLGEFVGVLVAFNDVKSKVWLWKD